MGSQRQSRTVSHRAAELRGTNSGLKTGGGLRRNRGGVQRGGVRPPVSKAGPLRTQCSFCLDMTVRCQLDDGIGSISSATPSCCHRYNSRFLSTATTTPPCRSASEHCSVLSLFPVSSSLPERQLPHSRAAIINFFFRNHSG
jgi:hypothetical protein